MAQFKIVKAEGNMKELKADDFKEMKTKQDFGMSQLEGIRRGQAYNLAVQAAIADGKNTDKKEILSYFYFYYDLAKLAQTYSLDEIKSLIQSKELLK